MIVKSKQIILLVTLLYTPLICAVDYDERSLEKLFTTPAERSKIDSEKSGDVPQFTSRRVAPTSIKVDGVIVRSKGKNTVWINGNRTSGNRIVGGVKVFAASVSKNNLKVPVLVDGRTVRIKPGQSWSEETDSIVDSY